MSDAPSVIQLVTEVLDSGRSPEEVCLEYPNQLDEVRRRVARCRKLASHLDDMFSPPDSESDQSAVSAKLPSIPLYQVQAIIGEGGMGVVYSAQHLKLKRTVAVKMLRCGAYASPAELGRFSLEAETVAGLQHPHIVQIHDLGEVEGRPYFTMEYLEGGSLAQKLDGVPLPPDQAVKYLITMASAVDAAHRAGIVHRDLKPANVLFSIEGQLKISDFGLARRITADDGLTIGAARIGTPSYMAPEQASGRTIAIGPSADIYALGAILYEMLTGRPPFRGVSAADTERQVINDDPAAPRRLNTSVPRDLETICLKCLQKDPHRRYASAAELETDLARFQRGEPILARKTGKIELTTKWVRRHPAMTTGIVGTALVLCLILFAGVWWFSQRSALTLAVNDDLQSAIHFQQDGKYANADASLERATVRLGDHGPAELRHRLEQARKDSQLVVRLDQIKMRKWRTETTSENFSQAVNEYAAAFKDAGFGTEADAPAVVAGRICDSPIRLALLDALDDWARCLDSNHMYWVTHVAELVDPAHTDPNGWRAQVRNTDPKLWSNGPRLRKLVADADVEHQPATVLLGLLARYVANGGDPIDCYRRIRQAHPNDFQTNLEVASYVGRTKEGAEESIRYLQTATAIQPDAAVVHYDLGAGLMMLGRTDEACIEFEKAVKLNPSDLVFQGFLGEAYWGLEQYDRAIPCLEAGLHGDPAHAAFLLNLHHDLAVCYAHAGRDTDAVEQFRLSIGLQPDISKDQDAWRRNAIKTGEAAELCRTWQWALKSNPPGYDAREGYAELCLFIGNKDDYKNECATLLKQFGDTANASWCTSIGTACLLAEQSPQDLARTVAMVNRAVAADPNLSEPLTRLAKALSEYRQGHSKAAIALLQANFPSAVRPTAHLILAMAQFQNRQPDQAHKALSDVTNSNDWDLTKALTRRQWISQVLRREAEKTIMAN